MTKAEVHYPLVSIGLPVYNAQRFLAPALDSLLGQTYTDFELIICDNCSLDQTEAICRSYAARDSRIIYHRHDRNLGVARNFNATFNLSRGRYFKWAAADDVCDPTFIEKCAAILEQRPDVVLCYPKTQLIDDSGTVVEDYEDRLDLSLERAHQRLGRLLRNLDLCNALFGVIRSSALRQTGLHGIYPSSDVVLLSELALHGRFYEFPERLFLRRVADMSIKRYPSKYHLMAAMFDPSGSRRWLFPNWELFWGHLSAIHRTPMAKLERLRCYFQMRIWLGDNKRGLVRDLLKVQQLPPRPSR